MLAIAAHENALACLCISPDGRQIGTASNRGTCVRVWDTASGAQLYELRRGMEPALIRWLVSPTTAVLSPLLIPISLVS